MAHRISAADIDALFTGYKDSVENAFGDYTPRFEGMYKFESSEMEREAYPITASSQVMTRWVGSRDVGDVSTKVEYVENGDPWQVAVAVKRKDIELRRKISLGDRAADHGKAGKALEDDLIKAALQGGAAHTWADGASFFSTSHPVIPWDSGAGTWINYAASGFGLTAANFETALERLMALKGWDGQEMGFDGEGFVLTVPPQLRSTGMRILKQVLSSDPGVSTAGGNTNINYGVAELRVVAKLANEATTWYLSYEGGAVKPLCLQEWRPFEVTMLTDLNSSVVFNLDEYRFGADRGLEYGYMMPHRIARYTA